MSVLIGETLMLRCVATYLFIVGGVGGRGLEKLRSLAASGADGLSESTLCGSTGYTVV